MMYIIKKKNQYLFSTYLQFQPFQENLDIYSSLEQHLSTSAQGTVKLAVAAENDSRRLHCTLRDLSSLLQAVGRLADHFIAEKFQPNFSDAHTLIQK